MDIKARPMKPKIRLVPAEGMSCEGCVNHLMPTGMECGKLPVRCITPGGTGAVYHHIKHVGEHPSTR